MVLGYDFHGEMILEHTNVRLAFYGFYESALYFKARVVGVVQNAKFGMSSLAVQIVCAVALFVEVNSVFHEKFNAVGRAFHHLLYSFGVAYKVARYHCVFYVFLEVINFQVGNRSHAALSFGGVSLFECGFAYECHFSFAAACHTKGITHACHAGTYYQEIEFTNHCLFYVRMFLQSY